ncbi:MAG: hypothetical protein KBT03_04770 [Bacteroidales bacterium]|nr:hypothetical protein [Candidatus Scybalousia scybalohippi]
MSNEWVSIDEDMPLLEKGLKRVSVPINILLKDGTVVEDGFACLDTEEFYSKHGKHIPKEKVKGWQTR